MAKLLPRPPSDRYDMKEIVSQNDNFIYDGTIWDHVAGEYVTVRHPIDNALVNPFKSQEYSQITFAGLSRPFNDDELGFGSNQIRVSSSYGQKPVLTGLCDIYESY